MSTVARLSPSREFTGDRALDLVQTSKNELVRSYNARPLQGATLITGTVGADGTVSDGITFTTGQSQDIPHGLADLPSGFLVVDARDSAPLLRRNDDAQPKDFRQRFIRLVHDGASTTRVKVLVF